MTDKTVSACQNCENVAPNRAISVDKDGKCIFCHRQVSTPTTPTTETVSECNCIDCRVGRDLGLKPKLPPTEPISLCQSCYCMTKTIDGRCGKCKADKPTVEKWGGDQESNKCEFCGETKPVQRYYLRVKNKHFDDNKGGCYSTFIYYCQDCGIEDTLSVQEAKAELAEYCEHTRKCVLSHKYPTCTCGLDDLLASLKQEEEVLVGIDMEKASADLDKELTKLKQGGTK